MSMDKETALRIVYHLAAEHYEQYQRQLDRIADRIEVSAKDLYLRQHPEAVPQHGR